MGKARRILVCGGRGFANPAHYDPETQADELIRDREIIRQTLEPLATEWEGEAPILIHGFAKGADITAERMWSAWGCPTEGYRADWERYKRAAGAIRNQVMLDTGIDEVIAFPGGKGTHDMCQRAERAGVLVTRIGW